MKLEVGKFYKTRDGRKALLESACDDGVRVVILIGSKLHKVWNDHLIAEWTDTPTTGTLAEIGAQVGDVVELMETDTFRGEGALYEIKSGPSGLRYAQHTACGFVNWGSPWKFRIVSRASDYQPSESECIEAAMAKGFDYPAQQPSPVITETVKRIVPGVYGKVYVYGHVTEGLLVGITEKTDERDLDGYDCATMSRAELIAARDVFNQLIDAMPHE